MPHLVAKPPAKIILLLVALAICCVTVVYAQPILYNINIYTHFNGWIDNPYIVGEHDCSDMSKEVEEYVETQLGLDCYIVYGADNNWTTAHEWNLIFIDDKFYEFESTALVFMPVSINYKVHDVQQGFYIDGVEYDTSQPCDNWREIFGDILL